ncbi:MAG: Dihydroorotate dehydrogenase B (NAD(+)), electron transfer subunit [Phycisphaerae bacterium]|nr:Dihydroorotate dehydrogenase B (NAD(+)), electron transfer subunit [Phycisphaerae bacterium]
MVFMHSKVNHRGAKILVGEVHHNEPRCREHYCLQIRCQQFPAAEPGQFVHLIHQQHPLPPTARERNHEQPWMNGPPSSSNELLIRRAFSIAGIQQLDPESVLIDVIYRVVGKGTRWMASQRPGDPINVLGPLGNCFTTQPRQQSALLVAGGVGVPPMIWWAEELRRRNISTVAIIGVQRADLLPLKLVPATMAQWTGYPPIFAIEEFARSQVPVLITTDDGTLGTRGWVTDALQHYLTEQQPAPTTTQIYTCGPEVMMRRVAETGEHYHFPVQVCMERSMACGMGTCQSCVVAVQDDAALDGWRYELCCSDGPIFDGRRLRWTTDTYAH